VKFASSMGGLEALGQFERWTIDPLLQRVDRRVIDGMPQEFPRIDDRRFGQSYRYAYTVSVPPDGDPQLVGATKLYKHDLEIGSRRIHEFGDGHLPGEFLFVPRRHDAGEDEGWLIGFVINSVGDTTDLIILDAQSFEAAPVATVRLPHRIPPGFHGNWFTAA
jgi:carotenoid cleavage dioxygenase-like enzyme